MFRRLFARYWTSRQEEEITHKEDKISTNLKELEHEERKNESHGRKRKLSNNQKIGFGATFLESPPTAELDSFDSSEEETEYDLKRKKNLEEREQMLRDIGVTAAKNAVKDVINKIGEVNKQRRENATDVFHTRKPLPLRESMRLKGQDPQFGEVMVEPTRPIPKIPPRISADPIEMKLPGDDLKMQPCLSWKLSGPVLDDDDLVSFKSRLQNMKLSPSCGQRIVRDRVTAIAVHPCESNLLIAAGDTKGNIGFWKVKPKKGSCMVQSHSRRITHTSFSVYSSEKLISTSLDGTVRCSDLNKEISTQIYASDENTFGYHAYWHAEMSREVLLIAHGSGEVGIIDQREGKLSYMYKCHGELVTTVQCHPIAENYFVTGSESGKAQIWDIRDSQKLKPEPVIELTLQRHLAGCFFSPAGNYLLATCNNGFLKVFDTKCFISQIPKVVLKMYNFGKKVTIPQAKWCPKREDAYVISNLVNTRRAAVYDMHGHLVHGFMDPEIQGSLNVCEFHPTQLVFVGGTTSGRVYTFV